MKINTFLFIIYFSIIQLSNSQTNNLFVNYNSNDGLPSSETYDIIQDKKGFMWIATDRGVARFDGNEFEIFTNENGLIDNVIFSIYEDYQGRIWFLGAKGTLCYFENNQFYNYKYNSKLKEINPFGYHSIYVYVDKNENIYLSYSHLGLIKITNKGEVVKNESSKSDKNLLFINEIDKKKFISYIHKPSNKTLLYSLFLKKNLKRDSNFNSFINFPSFKFKTIKYQNILISIYHNILTIIDLKTNKTISISLTKENSFLDLCIEENGTIITASFKGIREYIYKNGKIILKNEYFKNITFSSVQVDSNNNFWATSIQQGVFYKPSNYINIFKKEQGLFNNYIYKLSANKETILLSNYSNYQLFKNNRFTSTFSTLFLKDSFDYKIKYFKTKKDLLFLSNGRVVYDFKKNIEFPTETTRFQFKGDTLYYLNVAFFGKKTKKKVTSVEIKDKRFHAFNTFKKTDKEIWIGAKPGIGILSEKTGKVKTFPKIPLFNHRTTCIESNTAFNLILATRTAGIVFKKKDSIFNLSIKNGLLTNQFDKIVIDKNENIWASSNKGLYKFDSKNPNDFLHFGKKHGLPSTEITDFLIRNDSVFISTKDGFAIIDLKNYKVNEKAPRLHIKNIIVDSLKIPFPKNKIKLPENTKNVKINFIGINYPSLGDIEYLYKIPEISNSWIHTRKNQIEFFDLPIRGYYTILLKAKNENGYINKIPLKFQIHFSTPFYYSYFFYIIIITFTLLISFFIVRWRLIKKIKYEKEKAILENKALQAQMNPHFLYNAMNSIQSLISSKNLLNAEIYLAKFSHLFRQVLENSREDKISLSQEIEYLTTYLDIEKLRFPNSFEFNITCNEKIESDLIFIPPMILQPFLENCILHGFNQLSRKGLIHIIFEELENKNIILCTIIDNGNGRINKKNFLHKSLGTKITKQRLSIINQEPNSIEYIDLINSNKIACGTKVLIKLPIL